MKKIILTFSFLALLAVAPNFGEAASLSELKAQLNALSKQIADMQKAEVVSVTGINEKAKTITILTPNGGEEFVKGKNMLITFEALGQVDEIDLFMFPMSEKITTLVRPEKNYFSWQIPDNIKDAKNYRIRAYLYQKFGRVRRLLATDISNAPFSIVSTPQPPTPVIPTPATPSIKVVSPNGGESLNWSGVNNIVWNYSGLSSVAIALYKNNSFFNWINASVSIPATNNAGASYDWTPSETLSEENVGNNIFKIWLLGYKTNGGQIEDYSDAPFSIVSAPSGGGGGGGSGSTLPNLHFSLSGGIESIESDSFKVKICNSGANLSNPTAVSVVATANNVRYPTSGFAFMSDDQVPYNSGSCGIVNYRYSLLNMTAGNSYNVNINIDASQAIAENNENDNSKDFKFTVPGIQPSITVLSPNGGEKFGYGGTSTINWTSQNIPSDATIQIIARKYLNNGNTGENYVIARTANDGTETMKLIDVLNGGLLPVGVYKINVTYTDKGNWVYQDWGDSYFFIMPIFSEQ